MVYVNDKKFACESCIKGHRSSSCQHTERPLFEVKRKGRPVSQCDRCRQLRQSKRMHSRCTCDDRPLEVDKVPIPSLSRSDKKPKRFMPSVPTLPNGLSDVIPGPSNVPSQSRQSVNRLLNPCNCSSTRECRCGVSVSNSAMSSVDSVSSTRSGLAALAHAAALQYQADQANPFLDPTPSSSQSNSNGRRSCCQQKHPSRSPPRTIDLPPIHTSQPFLGSPNARIPDFASIPPLSAITSIAGSGCTCGFNCACPGCVEHRGEQHASRDHKDCKDGCGYCVDPSEGVELPTGLDGQIFAGGSVARVSPMGRTMIDQFLARAAALPSPPAHRKMSATIDPMNVTVYPSSIFAGNDDRHGAAYGLVRIPRLECCSGNCGCPEGGCGCRAECGGCCSSGHSHDSSSTPMMS